MAEIEEEVHRTMRKGLESLLTVNTVLACMLSMLCMTYYIICLIRKKVSSFWSSPAAPNMPKEDGDRYTFEASFAIVRGESSRPWSGDPLQSTLECFLKQNLGVSGNERKLVLKLSHQIATALRNRLQERTPQFKYSKDLELVGSASDATMIQDVGDCDYLLHMDIPSSENVDLDHQGEGYWRLRLMNPSEQMKKLCVLVMRGAGTAYYCLNPLKVHAFLMGQVQWLVNYDSSLMEIDGVKRIRHTSCQAGPAIKFEVKYNSENEGGSFDMDFVPCLTINGRQLVSKRHPSVGPLHELTTTRRHDPATLGWRQSFSPAERDRILPLVPMDGWECTKKVYRVVKYLRYHDSQFRQFNSFIYKNVFLYLLDDYSETSDWGEEDLADRFLDFMKKLEAFFKSGELYHYYLRKKEGSLRDLLGDHDESQITEFYSFLHQKNKNPNKKWGCLIENL